MITKPLGNAFRLASASLPSSYIPFLTLAQSRSLVTKSTEAHASSETSLNFRNAPSLHDPQFGPPIQFACYSRSSVHGYRSNSTASLRRFVEPALGTNLAEGMDLFFNRPKDILRHIDKPTRLDAILDACKHESVKVGFLKADVVTTKGALVSLLHRTGAFNVSFLDGKLYIDKHFVYDPSPTEIKRSWVINKNGYVGKYGFELACTAPRDTMIDASSRHQAPHGLNDWRAIICTYLGGFNLLLAGDIPCVKAPYTAAPANYMELKCRKLGSDLGKDLKDWYFRAHIMGASGVFVGYRDDEHVLRAKEFIPTTDILARLGTSWDPTDNINRLFQVLYTLREHCQQAVDQLELRNDHRRKDITWNMGFRGGGLYIHELTHDEAEMNIKSARSLPQPLQKRAGTLPRSVIKEIQKSVMTRALEMN